MKSRLDSWFAMWHSRYRACLAELMVAGTLASALTYAQNDLLGLLTLSLGGGEKSEHGGEGAAALLTKLAEQFHLGLPLLALVSFITVRLVSGFVEYWKTFATGRLGIRARDDLETEILLNLLNKDDSFFSRHSPAETVNRLAVDLYRVSDRRSNLMKVWWSALLLAGNLTFFFIRDWRLAVVGVVACVAGALWTMRATRPVKEMDEHYLEQDDRIKSRFEDFLRAAPEVQVGHLYQKIRDHFTGLLGRRSETFLKYIRLNSSLRLANVIAYLLAFIAMILVVVYMRKAANANASAALALVPVVVWALPELFRDASELVFLRLEFQIARASMNRLLEYEAQETVSGGPVAAASAKPAVAIDIERATYRYTSPDGTQQGGVVDVSASFAPGRWTAIVGGAGSGKSTLLKLLLGRLKPQAGSARYGQTPLDAMTGTDRAAIFSLMPQSIALLDASIRQNLFFGRPAADGAAAEGAPLAEEDMSVIERTGLGRVCRLKALDMSPGTPDGHAAIAQAIVAARHRLRERLREACEVVVLPLEEGHADRGHWVLESLLAGRCDRERVAALLLGKAGRRKLHSLPQTPLGSALVALARGLLEGNRQLLGIANYHVYCQLSPYPLDEGLWRLRSSNLEALQQTALSPDQALSLCIVALTASAVELADDKETAALLKPDGRHLFAAEAEHLKQMLGDACLPFASDRVHPHLTWRENLIFGVVDVRNSRSSRLADRAVLDFVEQEGLKDAFTQLGLEFKIGRLGGNLSGGQGQLVALCRALLRRTPVLVIDEPTSALDPASRAAVAVLLQEWKKDRIVIAVSHDVEFIQAADEIRLIEGGRLVAAGTFKELQQTSETFRRTIKHA
ncbi:MAG: ATP-binding cassette domain-containing protein [Verrucomicrobia bacterium]|nr:ATP-binding cassette domain-containing protein [Verrucomicrobiota bacterium]